MTRAGWLLLLAFPASAFAGTTEIIDAVESKYAGVESLTASFTQVTKSELYGADTQAGTIAISRPAKMRWVFDGTGKQFVTDGATMWIYNPADKQVLKYNDVSQSAASAENLLGSLDRISELFEVELLEDTKASKRLSLKPKGTDAQVKKIELSLTGDLVLQELSIVDAFDTHTDMAFKDVQLDAKLADSHFAFKVPTGAEVISAN